MTRCDSTKTGSGHIVRTKSGKEGRTYFNKPCINNKVPVYLRKPEKKYLFEDTAILCHIDTLIIIGYID